MSNSEDHGSHSVNKYSLWGGRFEATPDALMKLFNDSLPFDKRLWREDITVKENKKDVFSDFNEFKMLLF